MPSLPIIIALAALLPWRVHPALLFSPPTLVAFSSATAPPLSPTVPDKFYPLAPSGAGSPPLLFGVQDAASFSVSADAGVTWVTAATPHDFTPQGDLFVPLFDGAAGPAVAAPSAYHSVGSSVAISAGGWEQRGITTVHAAAAGGGAALAQAFDAAATSTFGGVPAPGLNATCSPSTSPPCDLPRLFGAIRLSDGSYLLAATAAFAGTPAHPTPDGTRAPVSLLAFASPDSFTWRFAGVIANVSLFPWTDFGPTESDLAYAADGVTLVAVIRMSGDADCEAGNYRNYFSAFSSDEGRTWSLPAEMPGVGCVRPKLLQFGVGGPLLISGGRNCVADRKDISLWESAAGGGWVEHSLSFQHNRLWQGNASFLFDARVNATVGFETQSYTSLVRTGAGSFAVFYNKFFSPNWPPWPSANFMMQVSVV